MNMMESFIRIQEMAKRLQKAQIETTLKIKKEQREKGIETNLIPEEMIVHDKLNMFLMYESNIQDLIIKWLQGDEIELCAAFCNYLLDNSLFVNNTVKTATDFALVRYACNISSSIDKLRRKTQKNLLERRTNEIKRQIVGRKYGKL